MSRLDMLQHYLNLGWVVVPTQRSNSRAPSGENWQLRTEPVTDTSRYRTGAFLVCGRASGVSVIDLDGHRWDDRFETLLEQHPTPVAWTPSGGTHILVRYSEAPWWNNAVKLAPEIDLRTEGGGISLPFGMPDRGWYEDSLPWVVELADPEPYEQLIMEIVEECRAERPAGADPLALGARSDLASLLSNPPRGEGGRNDWLVRVAGHLAPGIEHEDGWLALVRYINSGLDDPLPAQEVYRTVAKMWRSDKAKRQAEITTGKVQPWSIQGRDLYYKKSSVDMLWLHPAPEVIEKRRDSSGDPSWKLRNGNLTCVLRPADIFNGPKLQMVLAKADIQISASAVAAGENGNALVAWLDAQPVDVIEEYPWWGWNDGYGWVGLDEQAAGPEAHQPVIGDLDRPDLIEQLPTWQEAEVAAVFCAWVALQAVKGRINEVIESNLVLRGSSGSGKTQGLFSFGARLTGSKRSAISTVPTLRDHLASHRNGIVVIDDKSDLDSSTAVLELYRLSTTSEAQQLKRQTNHGWVDHSVPLVGSLLVSGEALLNLANDRALRDRSIILEVAPAAGRRSLRDPNKAQWVDIQAVFAELGGMDEAVAHQLAGPFIRRCLAAVDEVGEPTLPDSGDRVTIKLSLLRKGAEIWQAAYPGSRCDDGRTVVEAVDSWIGQQAGSSDWRSLTLVNRVLPDLAVNFGSHWEIMKLDDDGHLVVHLPRLSQEWCRTRYGARDREVGSIDNLRREMEVLQQAGLATYGRQLRMGMSKARVWTLSDTVRARVEAFTGVSMAGRDVSDAELPFIEDDDE